MVIDNRVKYEVNLQEPVWSLLLLLHQRKNLKNDAVRAEPTLHPDGERQDAGAGESHSGE